MIPIIVSHDHHFKWWFDVAPVRGRILAPPKRRVSKADCGQPHAAAYAIAAASRPYAQHRPRPYLTSRTTHHFLQKHTA